MRKTTTRYDLGAVEVRKRSHLPHWDVEHGIYFVTWNLIDAIPAYVHEQLRMQRAYEMERLRSLRGDYSIGEKHAIEAAIRRAYEEQLDKGEGQCLLKDPRCAKLVADALEYFDDVKCRQYCWSVMPNHVHTIFTCVPPYAVDEVLHSWKSYTSKEIGKILGLRGTIGKPSISITPSATPANCKEPSNTSRKIRQPPAFATGRGRASTPTASTRLCKECGRLRPRALGRLARVLLREGWLGR